MFELSQIPVIETRRLRLRGFTHADLAPLTTMNADVETVRYLGTGQVLDEVGRWRRFASFIGHWALNGYGIFAVEELGSGVFVGRVGPYFPPTWPELELGWTFVRRYWGRGYAGEAAAAARDWSFATLGVTPLASFIDPENARSIRVAEKLGAIPDGIVRFFGKDVLRYAVARA